MTFRETGALSYIDRMGVAHDVSDEGIALLQADVRRIAHAVATLNGHSSGYEALAKLIRQQQDSDTWNAEKLRQFCNGRGGKAIIHRIGSLIERIKNLPGAEIRREIALISPGLASSKEAAMVSDSRRIAFAFGNDLEKQTAFTEEYSGYYLVFRKFDVDQYTVALMDIGRRYFGDIAAFRTVRNLRDPSLGKKRVSGLIYRTEGMVYAVGHLGESGHARLSSIRRYAERDFYGLRLGVFSDEQRPFGTRIFCARVANIGLSPRERKRLENNFTGVFSAENLTIKFEKLLEILAPQRRIKLKEILKLVEFPDGGPLLPVSVA